MPDECLDSSFLVDDIRLIGIVTDSLSQTELDFYHNSNLPSLLKKQKENIVEKFFKISFNADKGIITHIEVISSIFRVPLTKDPWVGKIYSNNNSMLPEGDFIYLSYGQSVIPISTRKETNTKIHYSANIQQEKLFFGESAPIDYYNICKTFKTNRVHIRIVDSTHEYGYLTLEYLDSTKVFRIKPENDIKCKIYLPSKEIALDPDDYPHHLGEEIEIDDTEKDVSISNGMKIVVINREMSAIAQIFVFFVFMLILLGIYF